MGRYFGNAVFDKLHVTGILQPDKTQRIGTLPQIECADDKQIEVSIAVDICRSGVVGTGKVANTMELKLQVPLIFEPLHTVPWTALRWNVIKSITIGI